MRRSRAATCTTSGRSPSTPTCSRRPTSCQHEQVDVVDVDNGARFETYTIAGERGSGTVQINGAAARLVHTGDTVIVISYALYDDDELASHEPRVVHVEAGTNRITTIDAEAATLLA